MKLRLPAPRTTRLSTTRRALALLAAVALAAAGCGGGGGSGGGTTEQVLRIDSFYQPDNFDPALWPGPMGPSVLIRQYSEPLLKIPADSQEPVGAAAASYDVSPDGLTYTFHLRPDGRWNDGKPVTAADFVYAWRRVIDPRTAAPSSSYLADTVAGGQDVASLDPKADAARIDPALDRLGLAAPDDLTFRVTVARPTPYFKWIATLLVGVPVRQDVVQRYGSDKWATDPQTLVTNGPFKVSSFTPRESVTLVQNPYYRKKPTLTKMIAYQIGGGQPAWNRYQDNQLDISYPTKAALNDPRYADQLISGLFPRFRWLAFNTAKPPFDNQLVRLAFAQAIDRNLIPRIQEKTQRGHNGMVLTTAIPKDVGIPGYDPSLGAPQDFNAAKARATLAASGVSPGQLQDVHLLVQSYISDEAAVIQTQLQQNLGVRVVIDTMSSGTAGPLTKGDYQMGLDYSDTAYEPPFPDASGIFDSFVSTNPRDVPRWKDARYDQLVRQADTEPDPARRTALYQSAEQILIGQAPVAFLYQDVRFLFVKPWVKGLIPSPYGDDSVPNVLITDASIAPH